MHSRPEAEELWNCRCVHRVPHRLSRPHSCNMLSVQLEGSLMSAVAGPIGHIHGSGSSK